MPNRVLRDWTASEKMDKLSQGAEVFFTRLIMKADDYGLYYGNPKLLNSALFPLREYDNSQVLKWLNECVAAKVIHKYTVDDKDYIQIIGFDQRLRLMKSKFPSPPKFEEFHEPSNDGQMTDKCRPETKRNETEEENETETNDLFVWPSFEDFWDKYDKKVGKPKALTFWKKIDQGGREKIMTHLDTYTLTEKMYRKDPERYLKNKCWEDEVIIKSQVNGFTTKREQNASELKQALANSIMQEFGNGQVQGGG